MQGGQQYVQRFQEKIGVFSGSILNYHFAINNEYGPFLPFVLIQCRISDGQFGES